VDKTVETYPSKDYVVQYGESDMAFVERQLREWGISYYYEHGDQKHRLVLSDSPAGHGENPHEGYRTVRYHPSETYLDEECFREVEFIEAITSGEVKTGDYDFKQPQGDLIQESRRARETEQNEYDVYEWANKSYQSGEMMSVEANRQESVRLMDLARRDGLVGYMSGGVRGLCVGKQFELSGVLQPYDQKRYVVVRSELEIKEGIDSRGRLGFKSECRVEVRAGEEYLRPKQTKAEEQERRRAGIQTATVVVAGEQNQWTDEWGRVKVKFHWDRYGEGEKASCWVRVGMPMSGGQHGWIGVPRVGQEVLVDFEYGDPERPVVVGLVRNPENMANWELPSQVGLSGWRSRELVAGGGNAGSGRSNHLVVDDTEGKIQVQMGSDEGETRLSMGEIHRISGTAGREEKRGEGVELRTDEWGAVRAGGGVVVSTRERAGGASYILDMKETIGGLEAGLKQHQMTSEEGQAGEVMEEKDQKEVVKAIDEMNQAVIGKKGEGAETETEEANSIGEMKEASVVIDGAEGVVGVSGRDVHVQTGGHLGVSAVGHVSVNSGKSWLVSAVESLRWFVKGGVKVYSDEKDIEIRAVKEGVELIAKEKISHQGENIELEGVSEVLLSAGGSYVLVNASGVKLATAVLNDHTTDLSLAEMAKPVVPMAVEMGMGRFDDRYLICRNGKPLPNFSYVVEREDGRLLSGITDSDGYTEVIHSAEAESLKIYI
jgi:type VI secretion system secreted protein VgrG